MKYLFTMVFTILFLFTVMNVFADDFRVKKDLSLDAKGIDALEVEAGSGFLHIIGSDDVDEIKVTAQIEISDVDDDEAQKILDQDLELTLRRSGDTAVLQSRFRGHSGFFRKYKSAHVNITVELPAKIALYVDDGSGEIEINGIEANVEVDDGSGSIELEKIKGNIEIHDGSGSIDVREITGRLRIDDNSGGITVQNIDGDVDIKDGSGSITVRKINGSVVIEDGSGSIDISGVEQDVTIEEDGSGGVHISGVNGTVHRYDD
jgi:DUF4097 and DUF4098 domain-containing protein YvlB